jgi:Uma2 family endonuclease
MAIAPETAAPPGPAKPVHYPASDGKPMAETDIHRDCMVDAIETLQDFFADDPQTYVSGDLLLYYEEGNWRKSVAPDVFVVRGVPKHRREIYKVWEEGVVPGWVLEVTSRRTRREDVRHKRELYAQLGIAEYFLFDPLAEYLRPALQGYALADGTYHPIEMVDPGGAAGGLPSTFLRLTLAARGGALRLFDPAQDRWLPTRTEARQQAEARASAAEAELARLHADLERLRRSNPE